MKRATVAALFLIAVLGAARRFEAINVVATPDVVAMNSCTVGET